MAERSREERLQIMLSPEELALLDDFRVCPPGLAIELIGHGDDFDIDGFQQEPEFLVVGLGVGGIEKVDSMGKECALHSC